MSRSLSWVAVCGALGASLLGCTSVPEPAVRAQVLGSIADKGGLEVVSLPTTPPLTALVPRQPASFLTVYIEGDGYAWRTREWPSEDPTPIEPVAARLAVAHPFGAAAWLGRLCQYADAERTGCPVESWTTHRFSKGSHEVLSSGIDEIKRITGARSLILVGFSGGGAIAANLAAARQDVLALITVAGNIDLDAWAKAHGFPAFKDRVNPAEQGDRLRVLPQIHFAGYRDSVIPLNISESFLKRIAPVRGRLVIKDEAHQCCWPMKWPTYLRELGDELPWGDAMSRKE